VRSRITLTLTACALVFAACGGNSDDATDATTTTPAPTTTQASTTSRVTTTTRPTTTTTEPGPVSPLNGLPVDDESLLERQLIAVKIDNHWDARPQSGIEQTDAMMELLVEAGLTRFVALFHTSDSEYVGPMRSGRPTDPTIIRPLNGVMTISGAQPWVVSRILGYDVPLIGDLGRPVTFRVSGRRAPHNLYTNTLELREVMESRGYEATPPPSILTFGEFPADAPAAEVIDFDWSGTMSGRWEWTGSEYVRFTSGEVHNWVSADGETEEQISADTLVVIHVKRYTACPSGSGSCVPAFETLGSGDVQIFAEGKVVEGTWEREAVEDWFTITDADGNPIPVPPGHPWISFFPTDRTLTW
jgi:hypothetical protein